MRAVPKSAAEYAAKFDVSLKVDKYGIYGDEWDWLAAPVNPGWYPSAGYARGPIASDPKTYVRIVASRMGTGRDGPRGFERVKS